MIYFAIFFIVTVFLVWFILAVPVWIYRFGRKVDETKISSLLVPIRKNELYFNVDINKILPSRYIDRDIINDIEIVVEKDLFWGKTRLAGMSKDYFSYLKFRQLHVLSFNKSYILEKYLSNESIARLFVHEYFHRYLEKNANKNDPTPSDPKHSNPLWKELGI